MKKKKPPPTKPTTQLSKDTTKGIKLSLHRMWLWIFAKHG